MNHQLEQIRELLAASSREQRQEIFRELRQEFPIHAIEQKLNAEAEIILEAISRAGDLTLRGIRGIIAEAAFATKIVGTLHGWSDTMPAGNHPYDFVLTDGRGDIRVQVKMQRQKSHRPMLANEGYRFLPPDMYVVETQKTRGGIHPTTGEDTRPYKFNEFDILAVALHPSTGDWSRFLYTVNSWLLPRSDDTNLMLKFQPVPKEANETWTDSFLTCVSWFRSGQSRRLQIEFPRASRKAKKKRKGRKNRKTKTK
jgi:hypothetical protein